MFHGTADILRTRPNGSDVGDVRVLEEDVDIDDRASVLSQRRDPRSFPELAALSDGYTALRTYRVTDFGPHAPARRGQDPASRHDFLNEDGSNLALILADLRNSPKIKRRLIKSLRSFNERLTDFTITTRGGTVEVFFEESGLGSNVPASRISDGTIRFLCLLAILLHAEPPPLVCIEEPELGMHPDSIPEIADLLVEASSQTQVVVTTHSDHLVSRLSNMPEAVLVCDRAVGGTTIRRLERPKLDAWLADYSLGEVWMRGAIGGTRW
jgi:predicted ATPase